MSRTIVVVVVALVAAGVAAPGIGRSTPAGAVTTSAAPPAHPNVLFILTDDLDTREMSYLPHVRHLLGDAGVTFTRYYVSNSLCCPSRVTTLRGQYAHNTGVWSNGGDNGGFEKAYSSGLEYDTVATRLHDAGYLTSLTGKYLNGYPNEAPPSYIPPGWTNWASPVSGSPYSEYRYVLNQNGGFVRHGSRIRDYGTTVYSHITEQFIRSAARQHKPFFADLAVFAPHQPATPAVQDRTKFPNAIAPRTPSYDQADVSRSPRFVRDLPRFTPVEAAGIDQLYRQRIRSLQAVDREVVGLVDTLRQTHQLDKTYIVFASDNGFHLGQHRMPAGKQTAYETDIHVPLIVRGPGIRAGTRIADLAGNTDLAPTFEAMGHVSPPSFTDGRSLVPVLAGTTPRHWRRSYLVEHRVETGTAPAGRPATTKGTPLEPPDPENAVPGINRHGQVRDNALFVRYGQIPDYDAIRTGAFLYVEYRTGERELYDTVTDPDETDNLAGRVPAAVEQGLALRLHQLETCRAQTCRAIEDRPVPTPQRLAATFP